MSKLIAFFWRAIGIAVLGLCLLRVFAPSGGCGITFGASIVGACVVAIWASNRQMKKLLKKQKEQDNEQ